MKIYVFLFPVELSCHGGSRNIPFDGEDAMEQLVRNTFEKSVAWPPCCKPRARFPPSLDIEFAKSRRNTLAQSKFTENVTILRS